MAAYVESRQLAHLEPGFPGRFSADRFSRPGSSFQSCSFPDHITWTGDNSGNDDDDDDERQFVLQPNIQLEPSILDQRDALTADDWVKRNPSLIRVTENQNYPFNAEPPLSRLMQHGFVTPAQLHFVRNLGPVPRAEWDDWTVDVCGLVNQPYRFSMGQLTSEFHPRELPVTLVCAGNRRSEQNAAKQTVRLDNWGPGAVSTSIWRGARLRDVLRRCGILSRRRGALYVCFEGAVDKSDGGAKYGTSIRREVAMDPARDIVLAYMQNGEELAPDHGFPVRVIIPGFVECRMIKWLKKITVTTQESESYYHFKDNRSLPSHVDAKLAISEAAAGWWDRPDYTVNELNINSVMTTPCHEEILSIKSATAWETYTLRGYAYSGGGKKVTRVEVTMDGGETWLVCKLNNPEKATKYGKYWCWCFWSLEVESLHLFAAKEMAVRAWDECTNTQPQNLNWNLMGVMNNCWFRVKTHMCKPSSGDIGLVFQHPTAPGNPAGGWMAREKRLIKTSESVQRLKKSLSSPFMNSSSQSSHPNTAAATATTTLTAERTSPVVTATTTTTVTAVAAAQRTSPSAALGPGKKIPCKLVSKTVLSPDVCLFRFSLPDADQVLGLPVGKHLLLASTINGKLCMRAYTPTSSVEEAGHFDLLVKVYRKGINPDFPNGGLMSQHLDSLPLGAELAVKGPIGHIEYTGLGIFSIHGKPRSAQRLALIAGGTGITPIYQVAQAVLGDPRDETEMYVVYASRTEEEIMLREELDRWAAEGRGRFKVWYVVGRSVKEGWKYSTGRISEEILRDHIPLGGDDTLALACGPPGMIHCAVPLLEKLNYDVKNSLLIF